MVSICFTFFRLICLPLVQLFILRGWNNAARVRIGHSDASPCLAGMEPTNWSEWFARSTIELAALWKKLSRGRQWGLAI